MARPRNDQVNVFLILLLKDIIRYETGLLFDEVNAVTVCRYLELSRPIDLRNKPAVEQYHPTESNELPEGYSGFARHMWNKLGDLRFSTDMLDQLANGVCFFGAYKGWDEFVERNKYGDAAIYAEQFAGLHYDDIRGPAKRELHIALDGVFHSLRSFHFFRGDFTGNSYQLQLYFDNFFSIREAKYEDLDKIEKLQKAVGLKFQSREIRKKIFSVDDFAFFIIETDLGTVSASICCAELETYESAMKNSNLRAFVNKASMQDGKIFFIEESLYANRKHRDFLLNNIYRITTRSQTRGFQPPVDGVVNIFTNQEHFTLLSEIGFTLLKEFSGPELALFQSTRYKLHYGHEYGQTIEYKPERPVLPDDSIEYKARKHGGPDDKFYN